MERRGVGRAGQRHDAEAEQGALQPDQRGNGIGQAAEGEQGHQLGRHHPRTLGQQLTHERLPQRLEHPRQIEPRHQERDVADGKPHLLIDDYRQDGSTHEGQSLHEIGGGQPQVGRWIISLAVHIYSLVLSLSGPCGPLVTHTPAEAPHPDSNGRGSDDSRSPGHPSRRLLSGRGRHHGPSRHR